MTTSVRIKIGEKIPQLSVWRVSASATEVVELPTWLDSGTSILINLPGAYTPTCHVHHLPGFVQKADEFKALGIERIVCVAVNDHFVLRAWAEEHNALGKIEFLADFDAKLAKALGLSRDLTAGGLGIRLVRSALIIQNGVIQEIFVDEKSGQLTNTSATTILGTLRAGYANQTQAAKI